MTLIMKKWTWGDLSATNFNDEDQSGFLEVSPDAGKPFRRESFTDIDNLIRGSVVLSLSDYNKFKSWYRNTLRQGTIPFTFDDCRTGTERVARFLGKPSYSQISDKWRINVTLSLEQTSFLEDFNLTTEGGDPLLTEGSDNIIATKEFTV